MPADVTSRLPYVALCAAFTVPALVFDIVAANAAPTPAAASRTATGNTHLSLTLIEEHSFRSGDLWLEYAAPLATDCATRVASRACPSPSLTHRRSARAGFRPRARSSNAAHSSATTGNRLESWRS